MSTRGRFGRWNAILFGSYSVLTALVFVGSKMGLPYAPPIALAALRLYVAALVLLPIVAFREEYWLPRTRGDHVGVALTGVFTFGVMNTLLLGGQQYVSSTIGAIAYSLMPVLMTGFAVLLLPGISLDRLDAVGITLGFVGALLIADPNPANLLTARLLGVAVMVSSVAVFALGTVLTQRLDPSMPPIALTAWGVFLAGLFNHAMALGVGRSFAAVEWTGALVSALFVLGVLATGALYGIHFDLVDRIGPSRASLTFYVQPIVAAALGWVLFGQAVSADTVVGFLVVLSGFALVERRSLLGG